MHDGPVRFEPLILPSGVRLPRPEEIPFHDDRAKILERVAAARETKFVSGYVLHSTTASGYAGYAEINVHAPNLWRLFRDLVSGLLPEHAALLIGVKDGELHNSPYRVKTLLLEALEPYGSALAEDCFVQFGLIWQRNGRTEEVFVEPAKYLKVWTNRPDLLEQILARHKLRRAESLAFIDEYPRVTERVSHPPEMYDYAELIDRVLTAESGLPEATPPPADA